MEGKKADISIWSLSFNLPWSYELISSGNGTATALLW